MSTRIYLFWRANFSATPCLPPPALAVISTLFLTLFSPSSKTFDLPFLLPPRASQAVLPL
jgi:hypothetical protein